MAILTSKLGVSVGVKLGLKVGDDVGKFEGSMFVGTSVGIELGLVVVGSLVVGSVVGYISRNDEKKSRVCASGERYPNSSSRQYEMTILTSKLGLGAVSMNTGSTETVTVAVSHVNSTPSSKHASYSKSRVQLKW